MKYLNFESPPKKFESHGLALKPVLNLSFLDWLWILGSFCISKAYQVLIYPSLSVCRWWISVSGLFLHKSSFIPNSIQFVQRARRYDATLKLRQIFVVSSFKSIFQQLASSKASKNLATSKRNVTEEICLELVKRQKWCDHELVLGSRSRAVELKLIKMETFFVHSKVY